MDSNNSNASQSGQGGQGGALSKSQGVNIGWVLSTEQFPAPRLIEIAQTAEGAGFDAVWSSDHFQPWQSSEGHASQAWVTLSAIGAHTSKIKFGTGVTCPSYRYSPAVVAQAFATLEILYPGRVFLGLGSGEALNEEAATGQWDQHDIREARLTEAIDVICSLWTGREVNHLGQYFNVNGKLYDIPQQPVPMYVAANADKSMYTSGRYGEGLITDGESATNPDRRKEWARGVCAAGKDPANLPILTELFVHVGDEADAKKYAELWRFLPKAWTSYVNNADPRDIDARAKEEVTLDEAIKAWIIGADPQVHIQAIQKLIDAGVTTVFVHSAVPDQERVIDFFGAQVLPKLKR